MTTAKKTLNDVLEDTKNHSNLHDQVMSSLKFQGKSLNEWLVDCAVEIPDNMTPDEYRKVSATLARKLQKSIFFYSMANSTYSALTTGGDSKKNKAIAALIAGYAERDGKRPAAALIERMADDKLQDVITHRTAARILKEFWRDRRDALIETRKILESIGMSAVMEMKYLEQDTIP